MFTTLLVTDIVVVVLLTGVILLQKSEGGGLGLGTSSQGLFNAKGATNFLTKATVFLGATFFALSLVLVVIGRGDDVSTKSKLDSLNQPQSQEQELTPPEVENNSINTEGEGTESVPLAK